MKSCRSNCLLQQTEVMLCYMKDCVGVDEDMTVTKTTSEVGLDVEDVSVSQSGESVVSEVSEVSEMSVMSATSAMKSQTRSPTSEYACGKATRRESLEFVLGEEGVALRVTSEAARCRALSIQ